MKLVIELFIYRIIFILKFNIFDIAKQHNFLPNLLMNLKMPI